MSIQLILNWQEQALIRSKIENQDHPKRCSNQVKQNQRRRKRRNEPLQVRLISSSELDKAEVGLQKYVIDTLQVVLYTTYKTVAILYECNIIFLHKITTHAFASM